MRSLQLPCALHVVNDIGYWSSSVSPIIVEGKSATLREVSKLTHEDLSWSWMG